MLQLWLQLISLLCCSGGERVRMCVCVCERERERRKKGGTERQHVHQRATYRTLESALLCSVPPPFLSLPFLLVVFSYLFI